MPRILNDPSQAICPDFGSPDWDFLRQPMIDAHPGDQPLTVDEAIMRMTMAWTQDNDRKIALWEAQLEQDRADQEELQRLAQEEDVARRTQLEKEAEDQCKEAEKKKPKVNPFDPNRPISRFADPRPATYALNKIHNFEYVELDYFTARGCREAGADSLRSVSQDTLAFTQLDDIITLRPLASVRPSKNVRSDGELSWEEMFDAKNTMLKCIAKAKTWPFEHAEALASFFIAIELHPRNSHPNGKKALVAYQSHARREWFDAFKREEGFNIEIIEEDLLRSLADEVNDRIRDGRIDQVRTLTDPSLRITR